MKEDTKTIERVKKKLYAEAAKTFAVFAVTAVLGASLGAGIDFYFNTWPLATFILLGVFYFISWAVIIKMGFGIKKEDKKDK